MIAVLAGGSRRRRERGTHEAAPNIAEAESIVRWLLDNGAALSVTTKTQSRRTAADYAEEHGKSELAITLRELEAASLAQALARSDVAGVGPIAEEDPRGMQFCGASTKPPQERSQECKTRLCEFCGDRLGACKFELARARVAVRDETNPLIVDFFAESLVTGRLLAQLASPALHAVSQRRKFTAEFTESLAMLRALKSVLASRGESGEMRWHIVDLCCGKGFLATLVALLYPEFVVTAVDRYREEAMFLPHFGAAGVANVGYAQLDVLAPGFVDAEVPRLLLEKGLPTIVLGMHLCGLLSLRAIDCLRAIPQVQALVLAPCCLPGRTACEDTPADVYAPSIGQAEQYIRWCRFLQEKAREAACAVALGPSSRPAMVVSEDVDGVISCRRTLVSASRGAACSNVSLISALGERAQNSWNG